MYLHYKKKRRVCKLDKIDEENIYIEKIHYKYNEYNQISIMDKMYDMYLKVIKILLK
jgi:hypothetical protein